jgi:pimeloyl-ACP methyl ester carboxylesterase
MQPDNNVALFHYTDSQVLSYARYGVSGGLPVMYFHGLPGSCREAQLMAHTCQALGVDLIAPDRFGYGQSTWAPGDRYLNWVDAIARLGDVVGFERFHVIAASGGAPYGLACASLLQERILATRICCGLGSLNIPTLRNSMSMFARSFIYLADKQAGVLRYGVGGPFTLAARYLSRCAIRILGLINGEPDKSALAEPSVRDIMASNLHRAFDQGSQGAVADLQAALQAWPFKLEAIRNLQCWHGDRDSIVPLPHAQWLAEHVPGSLLHIVAGEGHFSLPIRHFATIVASLFEDEG